MKTQNGDIVEERESTDPGRRDADMHTHTIVEKVSDGPRKAMIATIGLLVAIASLLAGILVQGFSSGRWVGQVDSELAAQRADLIVQRATNREDHDAMNLQLSGVIESLRGIVTLDSIQNYQIRQNARALERIQRRLEGQ